MDLTMIKNCLLDKNSLLLILLLFTEEEGW